MEYKARIGNRTYHFESIKEGLFEKVNVRLQF